MKEQYSSIKFKIFTPESLNELEKRINNEKETIDFDGEDVTKPAKHYFVPLKKPNRLGYEMLPKKELEAGNKLPKQLENLLPKNLIGHPLEDIDDCYNLDYVFIVINRSKTIYRFNAKKSLFLFGPFSTIRKIAINILTHSIFSAIVMMTILVNCFMMATQYQYFLDSIELFFTAVYTFECVIKIIARGLIVDKFAFLRETWNWLDFIVILSAYSTLISSDLLGNVKILKSLRVIRALKTFALIPGLKTIVDALLQSVIRLRDVVIVTFFVLSFFALLGMQLYMGVLRRKCVLKGPEIMNDSFFMSYITNQSNWVRNSYTGDVILCGNGSNVRNCDNTSTCLIIGENPNFGYTSFDSYGSAMLSSFRLMTQDYWENLYILILTTEGPFQVIFFVIVIFLGSFYLINLMLAIVSMSYREQQENNAKEAAALCAEKMKNQVTDVLIKEINNIVDKKDSYSHYESQSLNFNCDIPYIDDDSEFPTSDLDEFEFIIPNEFNVNLDINEKKIDGSAQQNFAFRKNDLTKFLKKYFWTWNFSPGFKHFQKIIGSIALDPFADLFILICIILNTIFMALDHHDMNPTFSRVLSIGNHVFTGIFVLEAFCKIISMSPAEYFKNSWNRFDIVIVSLSIIELSLARIKGFSVLRSFRLLRVFKLAKSWSTLNRLMRIIGRTLGALGNLTLVLIVVIFIFAVAGMQLFGQSYIDNRDKLGGTVPRWSFIDFFHSFLIVFRVLCGEWIESMWDCMEVAGWSCVPFFLCTKIIGNLVVLNLFLALLLSAFGADTFKNTLNENDQNRLQEAFQRVGHLKNLVYKKICCSTNILIKNQFEKIRICNYSKIKFARFELTEKYYLLSEAATKIVKHKYFDTLIFSLIVLSSLALALEDKYITMRPTIHYILLIADQIFTYLFLIELILKLVAYGFKTYFSDGWCFIDFFIVFISTIGLVASYLGYDEIYIFRTILTLRALRPLRALSRFEGIRIVVNALIGSIPAIFNVMLVLLIFWLVFCIIGVELFAGKFYKCVYPNNSRLMPHDEVANKTQCFNKGFIWSNSKINFDNVLNGYVALFQVATYKGWIDIFADAADIPLEIDLQPKREQSMGYLIYFIIFIIFGSFFTLNLFIGVIIENFNEQKKKLASNGKDLFLTETQNKYLKQLKKIARKKPRRALPKPTFKLTRLFFDIITNPKFDFFILFCIILNMVAMCAEHYNQSFEFERILDYINNFFIGIFTCELILKILALHWRFLKEPWNVLELIIVIASLAAAIAKESFEKILDFSPTILRVTRIIRIGRMLRLIKGTQGIRTLLFSLAQSLPALLNIGLLLFLVMFIYAIFGMKLFMNVSHGPYINEQFNFETIFRSMITLFPLTTSSNWASLLEGLSIDLPKCATGSSFNQRMLCGNNVVAVTYLVSFIIIAVLVMINMYIAVILENFGEAREDIQEGLTDDDYDMYYDHWKSYDPKGTEFIPYDKLSEFVDSLKEPLRIPYPNRYKLISMDLIICENDSIHCKDLLDALTKNFLGTNDIKVDELELIGKIKQRPKSYVPITSTLEFQRKNYCAKIITRLIRRRAQILKEIRLNKEKNETILAKEDEFCILKTSNPFI